VTYINTVTCIVVRVTIKTDSSSGDWIYEHLVAHSPLITLTHRQYSAISHLHTFQFTVAHVLGFPVSTSRLLATYLNTGIITVSLNHTLRILHIKSSLHRSTLYNSRRELLENLSRTPCKRASVSHKTLDQTRGKRSFQRCFYCCVTVEMRDVTADAVT
jgi:hypothetical protein